MNGAVIRIRSRADVEESKNKLIAMLEVLFSCRARQDKMNRLEEYGLEMTTELEGCVNDKDEEGNVEWHKEWNEGRNRRVLTA